MVIIMKEKLIICPNEEKMNILDKYSNDESLHNIKFMTKQEYIDYIKMELTGGVLELEISDEIIGKYLDATLQELLRYLDSVSYITVPFASCIDLSDFPCSSVTNVYRTEGYTGDGGSNFQDGSEIDPMYAQSWMLFSNGGSYYSLSNYIYNYLAYNTLIQIRNTMSTELDHLKKKPIKLINCI